MNFPDLKLMPDVQSSADTRQLVIDRVGIRGLKYPMQLVDLTGEPQGTVVEADLWSSWPKTSKARTCPASSGCWNAAKAC